MAPNRYYRKSVPPPPPPQPQTPPLISADEKKEINEVIHLYNQWSFEGERKFLTLLLAALEEDELAELGYQHLPQPGIAVATQTDPVETPQRPPPPPPAISVATAATQTEPVTPSEPSLSLKSYAEVAASSTTDVMDIDPPTPSPKVAHVASKTSPTKASKCTPPARSKARAHVVHNIDTASPLAYTVRKVEMETRRVAIGARWLLSGEKRKGKKASSVVVYFFQDVQMPGVLTFGGRKHRVDVYEWGRACRG